MGGVNQLATVCKSCAGHRCVFPLDIIALDKSKLITIQLSRKADHKFNYLTLSSNGKLTQVGSCRRRVGVCVFQFEFAILCNKNKSITREGKQVSL